ncbi:MAG: hypothetical protein PHP25_02990 [Candidatus Moranbacteria bacterium]|nr:hypothetical protein [Candidatus Moranbacteria bacterium]
MAIENKKEKIKVAIVDVTSKAENEARDLAESRMTADKEELKGFKGLCKKIWKHNLARGWYTRREYDKARENIVSRQNLFAGEGGGKQEHEEVMKSITDRFISEYQESVHAEAGEQKEKLGDSEIEREIKSEIERVVKEYALQDLSQKNSRENFENEKNAILSGIKGAKRDVVGKGSLFADNLFEVVKQVQRSLEQGKKFEDLDLDFEVVVGRAKDRVRTEAQYNAVDRIVEKITHSKYGCLVNEAVLASSLSVVYCGGGKILQTLTRSRLLAWATFGATAVFGSGVAALRESQMFEEDRKRHLRDIAQGKKFDLENKPKRAEMEALRYETKNAKDLADSLEKGLYAYNEKGERHLREFSKGDIQNILDNLAEIESRIALSDRAKIDLISYSGKNKSEQEGLRLDLLRAQAKIDLEKYFAKNQKLADELFGGRNFKDFSKSLNEAKIENLMKGEEGVEAKNRIAKKMKQKKVAWAAVKGLGIGLAVGAAAQEARAIFGGEEESLFSQLFGAKEAHAAGAAGSGAEPQKYTALGYFYRWMTGNFPRMDARHMQDFAFGEQHFSLPRGASLLKNPDGTLQLLRGKDILVDHIPVDAKGHLTPDGRSLLASHDVKISGPEIGGPGHSHDLTPKDYIEKNKGLFHHIKRTLWYDNDTPAPVFDKNELKLWWGGKGGTGIDTNGNYVFNVKHMMPNGSYHKNLSVNAQDAMKSGKLKMLLSLSRGTQCDVVEVPIDANGNAVIDPNSEIGKTFFKTIAGKSGSKAVFTGKFAEVAQMMGEKNGVDQVRVLATHVGKGVDGVPWTPPVAFDMPAPIEVEPPPFIPVVGRWPLEKGEPERKGDVTYPYGYGYGYEGGGGGGFGLLDREEYKNRVSKKLLEDKNFDVSTDDWEITKEYLADQDESYLKELRDMVSGSQTMKKDTEVVITVPSFKEGKNLEKTLRNYAKVKNRKKFEIVILENHPRNVEKDDTSEVIEKIKKEFPDMQIVHLYKAFEKKPPIGLVRKYLVDSVLLRKVEAGIRKSLAIASNDADLEDISEDYVDIVSNAFRRNKNLDAVGAKWDYPLEVFKKFPLLHASQRLWHYFDIAFRNYYLRSPELIGRNSIFRSGLYAGVGGYNGKAELAEDLEIGWLIKFARNFDTKRIGYLNGAWLKSNPRRAVVKMLSGGRLVQQYGDFHANEEVRNSPISELLKEKRDFNLEEFRLEVQAIHDYYFQWCKSKGGWVEDSFLEKSFDRAMRFLGVKYRKEGEKVIVSDASELVKKLERNTRK